MRCTIVLEFDNGNGSVVKRVVVMRFTGTSKTRHPETWHCHSPKASHCSIVCSRSSLSSRSNVFARRVDPVWTAAYSVACTIVIARS